MKRWMPAIAAAAATLALAGCGPDDSKTIKFGFEFSRAAGSDGQALAAGAR